MPTNSQSTIKKCDGVPFVEWASELLIPCEVKPNKGGAAAKASLKRAIKLHAIDPKPDDLPMSRMKRE